MKAKLHEGPVTKTYLDDAVVREWHQTLRLRSESTASCYLQNMARIWRLTGLSPAEFVAGLQLEVDQRGQRVLNEFLELPMQGGGRRSEGQLKVLRNAMASWLDWNGREFKRKLRIGRAPRKPRASQQFVPDPAQLRRVLDAAEPRTRASIALMAFSGLRPEVQGSMEGDRGLTLSSLSGLGRDAGWFVADLPLRIDVDEDSSKNGRPFITFLGAEGTDYLLAYLNSRLSAGEVLGPGSPVIAYLKGTRRPGSKPFLPTATVTAAIRKVHERVGLQLPPYIWRSYFDTHMMLAESRRCIIRDYREFFMGHRGDIEAEYTVRKQLPSHVLEDMKRSYLASMVHVETRHDGSSNAAESVMGAILAGLGCSQEEVLALGLENPDPDAIQALVEAKIHAIQPSAPAGLTSIGPCLVDVPPGYEHLTCGVVVVRRDDRLYWIGWPEARSSQRARNAILGEGAPWHPGGDSVPADGRFVLAVTGGMRMLPRRRWPGND